MNENLRLHLLDEGIENLTLIQEKSIPEIMEGKDLLGISPTGTGKTYAYLIPVTERIDFSINRPQIVVLSPTHELCAQIYKTADALLKSLEPTAEAALIIGGANIKRQLEKLKRKPKLIVGTAGRLLELIKLKKISGHYLRTIVIDEADRMLDEQNLSTLREIIHATLKDRQLLFFTASGNQQVVTTARELSGESFTVVNASGDVALPESIQHMYITCQLREKFDILRKIFHAERIKKGIVFTNKSDDVDYLVNRMAYHGLNAAGIHGQADGSERRLAIKDFRDGALPALVASDLAARGLHIPEVTHVLCMDVPENPSFYLHRAGRSGRMGHAGVCITLATESEVSGLKKIERKYDITIVEKKIRNGKILDQLI